MARALLWKEALVLRRCLWLPLCALLSLVFPLAANLLATAPLFEPATCFLILSVAVSCMSGELVFRTSVGERRSGTLDVLLAGVPDRRLLTLCKILPPSSAGAACTLAGLVLNDLAAPLYTGRALFTGMLTLQSVLAVISTALISAALELVLLARSKEDMPLRGSTALIAAVVVLMSCLYAPGWELSPLLPVSVSMLALALCVQWASKSLTTLHARSSGPHGTAILDRAISPLTAIVARELTAIRPWLRLFARYAALVIIGIAASRSGVWLAPAAWFPALAFPAAEMLYPSMLSELEPGAMDVLRTALRSRVRISLYKCALPFAAAQLAAASAALSVMSLETFAFAELFIAISLAAACTVSRLVRTEKTARLGRTALYLTLAALYFAVCYLCMNKNTPIRPAFYWASFSISHFRRSMIRFSRRDI